MIPKESYWFSSVDRYYFIGIPVAPILPPSRPPPPPPPLDKWQTTPPPPPRGMYACKRGGTCHLSHSNASSSPFFLSCEAINDYIWMLSSVCQARHAYLSHSVKLRLRASSTTFHCLLVTDDDDEPGKLWVIKGKQLGMSEIFVVGTILAGWLAWVEISFSLRECMLVVKFHSSSLIRAISNHYNNPICPRLASLRENK